MYHHHHQPSYNPYAAPNPPQYASQYGGTWQPEPMQPNGSMNAEHFSSGFQRSASYGPQFQPYQPYTHPQSVPQQQPQYHHHGRSTGSAVPPPFQRHDSHQDASWYGSSRSARRTSVQQRWDDYINSDECTDTLQGACGESQKPTHWISDGHSSPILSQSPDPTYINQVTAELEARAVSDERLNRQHQREASQPPTPGCGPGASPDFLAAQNAERERRLKWAQDMIINNPVLCAEVYFAMSKPAVSSPSAASPGGVDAATGGGRSPGTASTPGSRTSSYSNSPT
ncbi:hypothetical protein IWZ00DRAFT_490239 [Phyllosticta capitalensis]|uniref:Uncharacterized protein n=1 Tax=Phyllosticta capitalensis TaxID=121624 RepID=A0ABR1YH75_9PEZI